MTTMSTPWRRMLVLLCAAALAATACGDDGGGGGDPGQGARADTAPSGAAGSGGAVDLAGVCPDPIVVQTDWFPSAEHGYLYQLIGGDGAFDAGQGRYRGPLGDTGVDLEIRAGGPFLGQQPVASLLYQDDDIFAGYVSTDSAIQQSARFPVVSVVAPVESTPQMIMWDPQAHDFESFADIAESGLPILVYSKAANQVRYLIAKGLVPEAQFDDSFDGSPARFVAAQGGVLQQGFVTNDPYRYEHDVAQFGRPIDYLMLRDAGFDIYVSSISVRADRFDAAAPCLEQLVPLIQQGQVDYMADPAEVNATIVRLVGEMASTAQYSAGLADAVHEALRREGIVANGPDDTVGNFDLARVERLVDELSALYAADGTVAPGLQASDIVTNQFIDPDIGL